MSLPNDEYFGGQSEYYKLFFVCYMLYYVIVIYMKIIFYFMLYSLKVKGLQLQPFYF